MTELQIQIIDLLKSNNCNVSESIEGICSLDDYFSFLKDSDFAAGVAEAKQKRDDVVLSALMELVAAGDKTAITDYQRMKRQDGDANDAKRIRKEFMRLAVELAETKGRCLKEYCGVFNASNKASEKAYADVVAEYNLTTPYERAKMAQEIHKESSSALFDAGNLSEVEMYSRMLSRALHDAEASEYPSERSKARADVISINQRLDEIQERERREAEQDETSLIDTLDAQLSGVHPSSIEELRDHYRNDLLGIEAADA
jgi:hypothetical protein